MLRQPTIECRFSTVESRTGQQLSWAGQDRWDFGTTTDHNASPGMDRTHLESGNAVSTTASRGLVSEFPSRTAYGGGICTQEHQIVFAQSNFISTHSRSLRKNQGCFVFLVPEPLDWPWQLEPHAHYTGSQNPHPPQSKYRTRLAQIRAVVGR